MPEVPLPSGTLSTAEAPLVRADAPASSFGANVTAGALGDLSQAAGQVGDSFQKMAVAQQNIKNKADADTAYSGYLQATNNYLFDPQNGYYSKLGKSAVDAYPQAQQDLTAMRGQWAATLQSPAAQQEFNANSRRQLAYTLSDVSRHAASENKSYGLQSAQTAIETQTNAAVSNWNNPVALKGALDAQDAAVMHQGALKGEDLPTVQLNQQNQRSKTLTAVVKGIVDNGAYADAMSFMREHQDEFNAQDGPAISKYVRTIAQPQIMADASHKLIAGLAGTTSPVSGVSSSDMFTKGILPQEGSSKNSVSPTGARGSAQMEPATEAQFSHVPLDADGDNKGRGQAYFNQLVTQFNGNQVAAAAAYNAGPGAVKDWENGTSHVLPDGKQTNPNHVKLGLPQPGQESAWAAAIPYGQTKAYVQGVIGRVGANPAAFDPNQVMPAALAEAQRQAPGLFPGDAVAQDQFVRKVQSDVTLQGAGWAKAQHDSYETMVGYMLPQNGQPGPATLTDLFAAHPDAKATYAGLDPTFQEAINNGLEKNANQANAHPTTEQQLTRDKLKGQFETDPQGFAKLGAAYIAGLGLPNAMTKELLDDQRKAAEGNVKPDPTLGTALRNPLVRAALSSSGLTAKSDPEGYQSFVGALKGRLEGLQATLGRKPTEQETSQEAHGLLASYGGIMGVGSHRGYAVPQAASDQIGQGFQKQFGRKATPDEVAEVYFRRHNAG